MSKDAKLTTVQKWEKKHHTDFDYDVKSNKVICMRNKMCKFWEARINNKNNFLETLVCPRTKDI